MTIFLCYNLSGDNMKDLDYLFLRLSKSNFRSRFHLKEKDKEYVLDKGRSLIEEHAYDFIKKRLWSSVILNDGKQTPMKGHPVFIGQHATGTCCRDCLEKWHHIPKGKELSETEILYIVSVIMKWIDKELGV